MKYANRLDRLRQIMQDASIDIMALIPGPNLRYLTGGVHYVMERPILMFITQSGSPLAVIPKMEIPVFKRHHIPSDIIDWTDSEGYEDAFAKGMAALQANGKTIGVEGFNMRFAEGEAIRRHAPKASVINADQALINLRIQKGPEEIASIRRAIEMSEKALQATLDSIKVGMSEIEIATILENHLRDLGSEGLAFEPILHTGGNTALPHMGPLPDKIEPGDPFLIDFGAIVDGYCADITRTVFAFDPKPAHLKIHDAVRTANETARLAAKPGLTAGALDDLTKQVLIDAGHEDLIRTRTGHGLGLEVHEPPYIVSGNNIELRPGMVFTIEPGLYKADDIGVRIEDDVLITEDGCESLTTFPREALVV